MRKLWKQDTITDMNEFNYCPDCSSKNVAYDGIKWVCSDCGYCLYNNIAAAVGLLLTVNDKILLFRRTKNPGKDKLGIPGGFVSPDENMEAACRRECREEIGIEVPALSYLCSCPNTYPYKNIVYKTCDVFFTAEYPESEKELMSSINTVDGEAAGCILADLNKLDLESLAFYSSRYAISVLKNKKGL